MKNDLSCAVVRDLLPSYTEGLTEEETNRAVEQHLEGCPHCRGRCDAMRLDAQTVPEAETKELDYLKAVNRRGKRRTIRAVAVTVALIAVIFGGLALRLFVIGEPATSEGMSWSVQEDGNRLSVRAFSAWSGVAYCRCETERVGDTVYIRMNQVLPSYLYQTADYRTAFSLEGVENVYLAGRLIWQDGEAITQSTLALLDSAVEYAGDAPALIDLALDLGMNELGEYTHGLHTSSRPYRWTVEFSSGDADAIRSGMTTNVLYMLALVENLDEAGWMEPDGSETVWDIEDADRYLAALTEAYNAVNGEDLALPTIKECNTPANLTRLQEVIRHAAEQ